MKVVFFGNSNYVYPKNQHPNTNSYVFRSYCDRKSNMFKTLSKNFIKNFGREKNLPSLDLNIYRFKCDVKVFII